MIGNPRKANTCPDKVSQICFSGNQGMTRPDSPDSAFKISESSSWRYLRFSKVGNGSTLESTQASVSMDLRFYYVHRSFDRIMFQSSSDIILVTLLSLMSESSRVIPSLPKSFALFVRESPCLISPYDEASCTILAILQAFQSRLSP